MPTSLTRSKLPIIGVMGSGKDLHEERSRVLGSWLAQLDVHLLCGGGGGVMTAVSRAFAKCSDRAGMVIGIIPGWVDGVNYSSLNGYPNPWIEIPIYTHLPNSGRDGEGFDSRNHINILTADVLVFLPGSAGTASESKLAVKYGKSAIAWLDDRSCIEGLAPQIEVQKEFSKVKQFVLDQLAQQHG